MKGNKTLLSKVLERGRMGCIVFEKKQHTSERSTGFFITTKKIERKAGRWGLVANWRSHHNSLDWPGPRMRPALGLPVIGLARPGSKLKMLKRKKKENPCEERRRPPGQVGSAAGRYLPPSKRCYFFCGIYIL
jgi:hypothetical protein